MASVQEAAQTLVRAIQSSREYKEWERTAKQVKADARAEQRLAQLRQQTMEIQAAHFQGEKVSPSKVKALEQSTQALQADIVLGPYLKAELGLMQMIASVQEALGETFELNVPGLPN